jgi:hypothetical protein
LAPHDLPLSLVYNLFHMLGSFLIVQSFSARLIDPVMQHGDFIVLLLVLLLQLVGYVTLLVMSLFEALQLVPHLLALSVFER